MSRAAPRSRGRRDASPGPAQSSPMPGEVSHDPRHRTHVPAQTVPNWGQWPTPCLSASAGPSKLPYVGYG